MEQIMKKSTLDPRFLCFSFSTCLSFLPKAQVPTIRILTCEKTELQTALYYSQRAVQQLQGECRHLVGRLHDSWNFARDLEWDLSAVATQKKKADRYIEELTKERDALSLELYRNTITHEELKEKNAELQEKLRLLESENSEIQLNVKELERKLERAKLLLPQQLQEEADHLGKELQSVSAKLQAQVEENQLWNRLYQQLEEKMWRQEEKIREQEEKIREQEEKMRRQEEKIWEQEEKMRRQEEMMREKREMMREQEEMMREKREMMREQEEMMWEKEEMMREQEEKMREEEEKMWRQEEKMCEQEEKMWRQEEMHEEKEKMRRQEEMMWEKEEKLREQEEKIREKEGKMREQEVRLWQQEEKMQEQEVRLQELEERLVERGGEGELWGEQVEAGANPGDHTERPHHNLADGGWLPLLFHQSVAYSVNGGKKALWPLPTGDALDREEVEEEEAPQPMPSIPEELESREAMVELVFPLVSDRNQGRGGLRAAAQNPAEESAPGTPVPQELGAANKQGDLYSKPCLPFFYRAHDKKAKIINI
uniref:golgin subfamily A member 6-like protein 6 n=1 Tax=Macaca mulatta TaxID=9544 RepID=UPI0010A240CA|nr:golgin subfamily A member 6-like protein 6 [Macaca mulatta]